MTEVDVVETIARERRAALSGYAFLICGSIAEADDATREAVVRTLRRRNAPSTAAEAEAAIKGEIVVELIRRARRRACEDSPRMIDASPLEPRTREPWLGRYGAMHEMLAEFTIPQRACLVVRYVDGLPLADCAALLGLSDGTVMRYLDKAVSRLRSTLGAGSDDALALALVGGVA